VVASSTAGGLADRILDRVRRNVDPELRTFPHRAPKANLATHQFCEALGDHKTDPCSFNRPGFLSGPLEGLKELVLLLERDSHPCVFYCDPHVFGGGHGDAKDELPVGSVVFDAVRAEVHEDLHEPRAVRRDHGKVCREGFDFDADSLSCGHRLERRPHLLENLDDVHGLGRNRHGSGFNA
jgi:hypothetical protein